MIASVGSWIVGSGTSVTRTSRVPCQVRAFIPGPFPIGGSSTGGRSLVEADDEESHVVGLLLHGDQGLEQGVAEVLGGEVGQVLAHEAQSPEPVVDRLVA